MQAARTSPWATSRFSAAASACGIAAGSVTGASSSTVDASLRCATSRATRVLPTPPAPTTVTSRSAPISRCSVATCASRPNRRVVGRVCSTGAGPPLPDPPAMSRSSAASAGEGSRPVSSARRRRYSRPVRKASGAWPVAASTRMSSRTAGSRRGRRRGRRWRARRRRRPGPRRRHTRSGRRSPRGGAARSPRRRRRSVRRRSGRPAPARATGRARPSARPGRASRELGRAASAPAPGPGRRRRGPAGIRRGGSAGGPRPVRGACAGGRCGSAGPAARTPGRRPARARPPVGRRRRSGPRRAPGARAPPAASARAPRRTCRRPTTRSGPSTSTRSVDPGSSTSSHLRATACPWCQRDDSTRKFHDIAPTEASVHDGNDAGHRPRQAQRVPRQVRRRPRRHRDRRRSGDRQPARALPGARPRRRDRGAVRRADRVRPRAI